MVFAVSVGEEVVVYHTNLSDDPHEVRYAAFIVAHTGRIANVEGERISVPGDGTDTFTHTVTLEDTDGLETAWLHARTYVDRGPSMDSASTRPEPDATTPQTISAEETRIPDPPDDSPMAPFSSASTTLTPGDTAVALLANPKKDGQLQAVLRIVGAAGNTLKRKEVKIPPRGVGSLKYVLSQDTVKSRVIRAVIRGPLGHGCTGARPCPALQILETGVLLQGFRPTK